MPEHEAVPVSEEKRIRQVESGLYLVARGAGKFESQQMPELDDEDREALRDVARGILRVWDALNG